MSIFFIVGPKCIHWPHRMLIAAALWWVTVSMPTGQTVHYAFR